ncbi:hypothetical protein T484DRAFT_1828499 [Baffinella frigidus]|nr:hypothetical protein T484DRAFT_1828499 [Cryptophyta sp. CCMP2293]
MAMRSFAILLCAAAADAFLRPPIHAQRPGLRQHVSASPLPASTVRRKRSLGSRMQVEPGLDTWEVTGELRPSGRIDSSPEGIEAEVRRLLIIPADVVCDTRGVCVIPDEEPPAGPLGEWGRILNEAMPSSVACGLRFSIAAAVLAPFLPQLNSNTTSFHA